MTSISRPRRMALPACFGLLDSDGNLGLRPAIPAQKVSATGEQARGAQNRHEVSVALEKTETRNVALREVLEQLHAHRSGVTDGVSQINGEHSRARDARRSNETVEQHRTKRDVSQVGTESGQGHPPEPEIGRASCRER